MLKTTFYPISIRGRIAYSNMCFEHYVLNKYPNCDFSKICKLMWNMVNESDYIDNSAYHYMEVIPEYLFEFETYAESDFEYISEEDFNMFRGILNKYDVNLNVIMHRIYDIAMEYAYQDFDYPAKNTVNYLFEIIDILNKSNIPLPDENLVSDFKFEQCDGWGDFINPTELSIIIKS